MAMIALHKLYPEQMLPLREWYRRVSARYVSEDGRVIASSRHVPNEIEHPPVGSWRIDDFNGMYGHEVSQLRWLDPHDLELRESMVESNQEGRGWDAERYAEWAADGYRAPAICVIESDRGTLLVIDGHRRVAAAKALGRKVLAWVSPAAETGKCDYHGKPMVTGLTHELAVRAALLDGKRVAPGLAARYREKIAEIERDAAEFQACFRYNNAR